MLRNNLSILLAERQLKLTRVAGDTGISRTTLTSLASNTSKMVQFETINKICQYLKVDISSFFEYVPFDFEYYFDTEETENRSFIDDPSLRRATLLIYVTEDNQRVDTIELQGYTEDEGQYSESQHQLGTSLHPTNEKELAKLKPYLDKLSVSFISDIKNAIEKKTVEGYEDSLIPSALIEFDKTEEEFSKKREAKN